MNEKLCKSNVISIFKLNIFISEKERQIKLRGTIGEAIAQFGTVFNWFFFYSDFALSLGLLRNKQHAKPSVEACKLPIYVHLQIW